MRKVLVGAVALILVISVYMGWLYVHFLRYPASMDVAFRNGDVVLRGVLVLPGGPGPHPAIVELLGSGPERHSGPAYRIHANEFARAGFAVLIYDKRGVGESTGDFETATLGDFASDAVAAVQWLASRDDIDASHIGLFASSEGGWYSPEAAIESGKVSFIINRCGPAVTWGETNLYEKANDLRRAGIPEEEITRVLDLRREVWHHYRLSITDADDVVAARATKLREEITAYSRTKAAGVYPIRLATLDRAKFARWIDDIDYDPVPYLDSLDVPLLAVFAANDENVPTARSVRILGELKRDHGLDVRVVVFDGVGHSLQHWTRLWTAGYVDGYLDLIRSWSRSQLLR